MCEAVLRTCTENSVDNTSGLLLLLAVPTVSRSFQAVQRNGCPIPGTVRGKVGRGFEQPGLVRVVPAHGRRGGTG